MFTVLSLVTELKVIVFGTVLSAVGMVIVAEEATETDEVVTEVATEEVRMETEEEVEGTTVHPQFLSVLHTSRIY